MLSAAWKDFEREVAAFVGDQRILRSGDEVSDVMREDGLVVAEAKYRSDLPAWIRRAFDQLRAYSAPIRFVAIRLRGKHGFYVLIHSSVFRQLLDAYLASCGAAPGGAHPAHPAAAPGDGGRAAAPDEVHAGMPGLE